MQQARRKNETIDPSILRKSLRTRIILSGLLNIAGMLGEISLLGPAIRPIISIILVAIFIGILLIFIGIFFSMILNNKSAFILYVISSTSVSISVFASNQIRAIAPNHWAPFEDSKITCFVAAVVAPTLGGGVYGILLHTGGAILGLFRFPHEARARLPKNQPFVIILYGSFAMSLLLYRVRSTDSERKMIYVYLEAQHLERIARTSLLIRDLTNSPVQTLEFSVASLRRHNGKTRTVLDRMERATNRIKLINSILDRYSKHIVWKAEDLSFDAEKELAKETSDF